MVWSSDACHEGEVNRDGDQGEAMRGGDQGGNMTAELACLETLLIISTTL